MSSVTHENELRALRFKQAYIKLQKRFGKRGVERKIERLAGELRVRYDNPQNFITCIWFTLQVIQARRQLVWFRKLDLVVMAAAYKVLSETRVEPDEVPSEEEE